MLKCKLKVFSKRRYAVICCLVPCIVSLYSYIPLLAAHIATAAAGVRISVPTLETITIVNVMLYIVVY